MNWQLPPEISWPQFLRLLRRPNPPRGWLDAAAGITDIRKRPMLLRRVAQHRSAPVHLRTSLISRLPWRALAAISWDPTAHPQARSQSIERLQILRTGLSTGERRSFAYIAPRQMWPLVWKIRDTGVISAFLQHSRLGLEMVVNLIQSPISPAHLEALQKSHLSNYIPVMKQVVYAIDQSLNLPSHGLALGMAAPWLRRLNKNDLSHLYQQSIHPLLKGMIAKLMEQQSALISE